MPVMLNRKLGFLNSFEAARLLWFPKTKLVYVSSLPWHWQKKAAVICYVLFLGPLHVFSCFAKPLSGNAFQKHTLSSMFQMPSAFYLSGGRSFITPLFFQTPLWTLHLISSLKFYVCHDLPFFNQPLEALKSPNFKRLAVSQAFFFTKGWAIGVNTLPNCLQIPFMQQILDFSELRGTWTTTKITKSIGFTQFNYSMQLCSLGLYVYTWVFPRWKCSLSFLALYVGPFSALLISWYLCWSVDL